MISLQIKKHINKQQYNFYAKCVKTSNSIKLNYLTHLYSHSYHKGLEVVDATPSNNITSMAG